MKTLKKVTNTINSLLNVIIVLIIILLIIVIISSLISRKNNGSNTVHFFNYSIYRVSSSSMIPELKVGDLILIRKQGSYNIGDIITFRTKEGLFTHRIVDLRDGKIITRGDANNTNDKELDINMIEGKVIKNLVFMSWLYKKLSNKYITIPLFIILLSSYVFLNKKEKEN